MSLTLEELYKIKETAAKIENFNYRQAQRDHILEDIAGLKLEILEELGVLYPLLLIYLALAKKEQYRFDPQAMYEAGKHAKREGIQRDKALLAYLRKLDTSSEADKLYTDMQHYHDMIIRCLGEKKGLVTELLDEYRFVYGGITRSAEVFFDMGYAAVNSGD